jgi:CBS domain-containing protein
MFCSLIKNIQNIYNSLEEKLYIKMHPEKLASGFMKNTNVFNIKRGGSYKNMKVRDVMTKSVATVSPDTTIKEAAQMMQQHNVGSIPVVDTTGLVGIVTDRDIVVRNIAHGQDPISTPVRNIMTSQVMTATPEEDVQAISQKMSTQQIRRVPVVENKQLVGMVSLGDIATTGTTNMEASEALTEISKPSKPLNKC